MRTQLKTLLVIFVALVALVTLIYELVGFGNKLLHQQTRLPNALAIVQTVTNSNKTQYPSGNRTTEPQLDGHMVGYDFVRIAEVLDDPCHQWHVPFLLAGWEESEWDTAKWIIYRESRCQADAFNGVDAGLMQINEFHKPLIESLGLRFPEDLFDGETNMWVANVLWMEYGWEPWIYKGVIPG